MGTGCVYSTGRPIGTCDDEPCLTFQKTPSCPAGLLDENPKCADGSGQRWKDVEVKMKLDYVIQLSRPMALELMHYGPIVAAMDVYEDFLNYTGGVYHQNSDVAVGGHAVKIIGFGSDPEPYWLVQNSWTTRWGEGGYFRIARGDDTCECDICNLNVAGMWFGNHSQLRTSEAPIRAGPWLY